MAIPPATATRRSGFTLIEILVVISIIALLIAIALPSLAQARRVARKTKVLTELATISTNLEMFATEFAQYPESNARRMDPIVDLPGTIHPPTPVMQGAHWLARALAGPDGEGVDAEGLVLKDRQEVGVDPGNGQLIAAHANGAGGTLAALQKTSRKVRYLGNTRLLTRDNEATRFERPFNTGYLILADAFDGPILYYRAAPKALQPFTSNEQGTGPTAGPGVYDQHDNATITGSNVDAIQPWDFAATGRRHGLGYFGPERSQMQSNPNLVHTTIPPEADGYRGRSFCDALHDHGVHLTSGTLKAINDDSFTLISAGADHIFGTEDDLTNFGRK